MSLRLRRLLLGLGLLGVVLSALSLVEPLLGLAGALLTAIALILQYRAKTTGVFPFEAKDWRPLGEEDWEVRIPFSRHGKDAPTASVHLRRPNGGFEEVICDVHTEPDRSVSVRFARRPDSDDPPDEPGEVRIT